MPMSDTQKQFLSKTFDKAVENFQSERKIFYERMFYISTGIFVLSSSLITVQVEFIFRWTLVLSWLAFSINITAYFLSVYWKAMSESETMDEIEVLQQKNEPILGHYVPGRIDPVNKFVFRSEVANKFMFGSFTVGLISLLFFASINFLGKQAFKNSDTIHAREQHSYYFHHCFDYKVK